MIKYAVSNTGQIMRGYDTRIKDGARWCVDYKDQTTGELCHESNAVEHFTDFYDAVDCSRRIRADILKAQYEKDLNIIQNGDYIVH